MEEIKQKVQDLELALNYVCYDAALIPKLSKVWERLEILQEAVNKKCNIPLVIKSVCENCGKDEAVICQNCYDIESQFRECY